MSLEIIHAQWQEHPEDPGLIALDRLRTFRDVEFSARERARERLAIGPKDLAALRYLLTAAEHDKSVSPTELSEHLGITSASTTSLIRRLEDARLAERTPHPRDGRGQYIRATESAVAQMQPTLEEVATELVSLASRFSRDELVSVARFLGGVIASFEKST
ncbi:MarR family winged helix-turn-helix transcriptional regulator [Haematomicrobium sanguinis]|uniref:MarR family winged helix-turn-helix transcriptional regulator n=1 Tax=Haematomicrobium sanguinis TaxID=479106 RepID=UPI00068A0EB5|nr:MarR family transcriptional regulator [Haematomicrobium sanguinis]